MALRVGWRLARDDARGDAQELQQRLWLEDALERLPVAIGLIDAKGRYIAMSGGLKGIVGSVIPSRDTDAMRLWSVFDDQGAVVDPTKWPGQRTLRGEHVMTGVNATFAPGTANERRVRVFATPFVDSTGRSAGLVLVQDIELERRANEQHFEQMHGRFVDTLVETIRQVGAQDAGDPVQAHRIIARVMGFSEPASTGPLDGLSQREEEVLRLLAWGNSRKEIATQLGITVKTVEFHRAGATRKLGLNSRVEMIQYAVDRGWFQTARKE